MRPIPNCEPTINTVIHENIRTTIVLIAVATVESVCFIPHFARIAVNPANTADPNANIIRISLIRENNRYFRAIVFFAF